jgi:hypothetical protein
MAPPVLWTLHLSVRTGRPIARARRTATTQTRPPAADSTFSAWTVSAYAHWPAATTASLTVPSARTGQTVL